MFHPLALPEENVALPDRVAPGIEFDLVAGLESLVQELGPRAHSAGLDFVCRVAPEVPELAVGDPAALLQIITLLVDHAARVTVEGEISVGVVPAPNEESRSPFAEDWTPEAPPASDVGPLSLLFEVSGAGRMPGLPDSPEPDRKAAQLIESLGGALAEHEHPGHARVWSFRLTLELAARAHTARSAPPPAVSGSSILVADDNATTRSVLEELLSGWGVRVNTAENGEKALAAIRQAHGQGTPFDALLLDARMPRLSGFDVAGQLAKNAGLCGPVVLLLPAPFRKGDDAFCRRLGVAARVTKPVRRCELLQILSGVLAGRNTTETCSEVTRSPSSLIRTL